MSKIHLLKEHFFTIVVFLKKEKKKIFFVFGLLIIFIFIFILISFYYANTKIIPTRGGIHVEGVIGSPRFINPIYAPVSDIDQDLTQLTFSGLMRYDENNQLVPALAKKYNILEDGRIFDFYLKEGLLWSDNTPITANDVIFTIRTVQNPEIHSPIRAKWLGVEVEKISELKVRFILKNPSPLFLENATLGIIPKHIWSDIPKEKFPLSKYNLRAISSGPYKVKDFYQNKEGQISSLNLIINPNYWGKQPYVSQITFLFFENQTELIKAFENNKITGFSIQTIGNKQNFENNLKKKEFLTHRFLMPRYFALFLNSEKSKILERSEIRRALNYGTDRKEIITNLLLTKAKIVNSPILPEIFGFTAPEKIQEFNYEKAIELLIQEGFTEKKDGIRFKVIRKYPDSQLIETLPLKLSLSTVNQPLLIKIAEELKNQWKKLGIELEIKIFNISELKQDIIKPRNYEILLFGQSLRAIPDPFSFWHSDQKIDPGLNLTSFKNRRADELLEKSRQTLNQEERKKNLEEFQNILIKENPALFLFNPAILYFASKEIRGISKRIIINPSERFNNIENWYIKTQRVWK
jgi:peptide/nickel transport system substrate-binding protein